MGADIDRTGQLFERVEIFREGFPIPFHAFGKGSAGNILHPFHEADEPFVLVRLGRREANAAIAHDDRRHAVPAGRSHLLIPGSLSIVMGVNIDKAGSDEMPTSVDFFHGVTADRADLDDKPILDGDVAVETVLSGTIDDGPVANDQIVCGHRYVLLSPAKEGSTLQPTCPVMIRQRVPAFGRSTV